MPRLAANQRDMLTAAICVDIPCPVNRKQNITTGRSATQGLNAIKKQEAARAVNIIGPSRRTRIMSVNPPDQTIAIADAKVPKP